MSKTGSRRLIVVRHAKSSWKSGAASDHERPLNKRGRHDAPRVARALVDRGWVPDLVLSSDSERTRETWKLFATVFAEVGANIDVDFRREFYEADVQTIANGVSAMPPSAQTLMIIGHNPTFELLVERWVGKPVRVTTCNAVLLESNAATWVEAAEGRWTLVEHVRPRELPA